jgi:RimJ/RimL family protein N-acetyltransferase
MEQLPELRTERLILRPPSWRDIPQIVTYAGDERIAATTATLPHPYAEKDAVYWLHLAHTGLAEDTNYLFGIYLAETEHFIGGMGLHRTAAGDYLAELGYWVAVPHWGRGYATEAAAAVLAFGFETLELHKIFARHMADNPASGQVMIKNGMIREGALKEHLAKNGTYHDLYCYRLLRSEYAARAGAGSEQDQRPG